MYFLKTINKSLSYYSIIKKQLQFTPQCLTVLYSHQELIRKTNQNKFLRLQVEAGRIYILQEGCQGFSYQFLFDKQIQDHDYVYKPQKHIVFAIDKESLKLLEGSTIDYQSRMIRAGFYVKQPKQVMQNPKAQLSCSCKSSFSPKQSVFN